MKENPTLSKKSRADLLKAVARRQLGLASAETTIQRRSLRTAPLSYAQARVWFIDQMQPGTSAYNVPSALRLVGRLDLEALRNTLSEIVRRHEMLRTTFDVVDGSAVQQVHAAEPVPVPLVDLSASEDQEQEAHRLTVEEAHRPFDLSQGPLLRATLIRLEEEEHRLLLTMHHIVSDGWSRGLLRQELSALYNAFAAGKPSPLPELPIQYADYAEWQRERLEGGEFERQLAYWKQKLSGAPTLLEMPLDRPRPLVQTFSGAHESVTLPTSLLKELEALSQQEEATLFMTLLAVFKILLSRYSGQDSVVVGTPIANRTRAEMEGLIGFFLNTLAMRTDLSGDPSFRELLRRVRETALGAYANQDLPFEKLVEELQPERSMSHSPLFQAVFSFHNAPRGGLHLEGLRIEPVGTEWIVAKFDLTLSIAQTRAGLRVGVEYNTDLFDSDRMERLLGHYQTLLEGIVADPGQRISRLPMLTGTEREQIVVEWNGTQVEYPRDRCIHTLFEEQVERHPNAVAVVYEDRQLTYAELNRQANQLANFLRKRGVSAETLVGVFMDRSLEMIVGLLGILKAGGAYVPLDPSYPAERLAFMLEDSNAAILLTLERLRDRLKGQSARILCLDTEGSLAAEGAENPGMNANSDNLAYVIYTSGSTGQPKGVQVCHQSLINLVNWHVRTYDLGLADRSTHVARTAFDASVWEVWPPLAAGATLCIANEDTTLAPQELISWLISNEASVSFLPTPLAEAVLSDPASENLRLRALLTGGDRLHRVANPSLPFRLVNHYGPTESTVVATAGPVETGEEAGAPPIGRPIDNTQIYILDGQLSPVPVGVAGELYIGGESLARGYLNRAELTAEKFVPDRFSGRPGARLYRTGDLVRYLPDGNIDFLGRIDHQVKIRGSRIELGEIESVLLGHPGVREAAVLAREDVPGDRRLVAYILGSHGGVSSGEVREYLRDRLPGYMIPSTFVMLESLPLTPNGKVDRNALPAPEAPAQAEDYAAPRTPIEEGLAEIWREVLHLEQVGIHDSFFELGGHSLLATQVLSRIRSTFAVELPLRALFEASTVAGLAERVDQARAGEATAAPRLVRVSREGRLPLSFSQQRLWFLDQFEPGSALYNIPMALHLGGDLDGDALRRSLQEIVRRHEALRTTFTLVEGVPCQMIRPVAEALDVTDLAGLPLTEREGEMRRRVAEEARRPFDLEQGPLFRTTLLRLGTDSHVLMLTMHHIVSDGWSHSILMRELSTLYRTYRVGKSSPLPELPLQYPDYAAWQREWLQGDVLDHHLAYWKTHLAGAPTILELPTDRPRPPVQTFKGAFKRAELSEELTQGIKDLCQREGVTLFMVLLAAFQVLLSRYSGQDDIVVGTPIANRTRAELEGLIGFFLNTLALRTDLSGDPTVEELLDQVRDVALGAYAHQDVPFEKLVDELQPERSLSHSPVFQVVLVVQNMPGGALELDGLQVHTLGGDASPAKFDLRLVARSEHCLRLAADYNTDLFDDARIDRLLKHLSTLLEGIVADPKQRISHLPLLTGAEREQLLVDWNDTAIDYPRDRCVHEVFEAQVERTPDAIAVTYQDRTLTYRELNARANQLAHYLHDLGVGPEVLVGLALDRSIEMMVAVLGILKVGGVYVPLDPSYPVKRLARMLEDAQPSVLLSRETCVDALPSYPLPVLCLDVDWPLIAAQSTENLAVPVSADNGVYVSYTSGSTGQPKGVVVPHRAVMRLVRGTNFCELGPDEVILQFAPLAFDASTFEIWGCLLNGGRLVLVEGEATLEELAETIRREGVTTMWLTAGLFHAMVESNLQALQGVRQLLAGGDVLSPAHVAQALKGLPGCRVINGYGPTENTTFTCCYPMDAGTMDAGTMGVGTMGVGTMGVGTVDSHGEVAGSSIPIGRPISNTRVYLLDGRMSPVPIGVAGELYAGGDGVARGYLNRPDLTAEKFVPDPFHAGERLYRTGDLGRYLPDGSVEFLGRIDQQVKIRGFRIELGEIESVLVQHSGIRDAVVVAREDVPGSKRLVAYLVGETGAELRALRDYLESTLPGYMVPSVFVMLEALPLTSNGKVDRKALPSPDEVRVDAEAQYEAPANAVEEALANIWCSVLRRQRVSRHDNFFELGGDSILSIQIISRANQAGLRLTTKQVFQHQTIATLAAVAGTEVIGTAEQGTVTGETSLTPIQQWFFEQERPNPHHFNQSRLLLLRDQVPAEQLRQVVSALVSHHDVLRTRYVRAAEGWHQSVVAIEENDFFSVMDLGGVAPEERSAAITTACTELQASLNLVEGPLLRVCYFESGAEEPARLLIAIHHLVVDGVSWRVLLEDLASGIEQLRSGEAITLPAKTTSFQEWAQRLEDYAGSSTLLSELDYWQGVSEADVSGLPMDLSAGSNTVASERVVRVSLDVEATHALLSEVPSVYHTQINDALLTALARSVSSWTDDRRVLVDLEGHGREALFEEVDVSRTVGWFTSLYPVLLQLPSTSDWGESLKRVKETLRGVPNRGLGYGALRYLSPDAEVRASLSSGAGPQISFNYHGQFNSDQSDSGPLGAARESAGPVHSLLAPRTRLLDVVGHVTGECLHLAFLYSEAVHARSTVERLAQSYLQSLRELITHCQSPQAGGYTPSDFPKAQLSQRALDRLFTSAGPALEDPIEDVYPLSPMQAGMLFHSLYATERAVYLEHLLYRFHGEIDHRAFEHAWATLIARHSLLRTSFHWEGLEDPVQVVHRSAEAPVDYRDWSHLSAEERQTSLDALRQEDREKGMDLTAAPLMRLTLIRTGSDTWQFLWTVHHLIIDRWSIALVLRELTSVYEALRQGQRIELPLLRPFGDYIKWIQQQDMASAEAYWRQVLDGFTSPTALPVDKNPGSLAGGHMPERLLVRLADETSSALQALIRQHRLTLNTLVQGAWALLLSRYSGEEDVLFGATVSGRPPELPGVESMVGMFINSLPVRVRVSGQESLLNWLQRLQEAMLELREHEYSSLAQIQSWSSVPRGVPLFDSLVIVQNTPAARPRDGGDSTQRAGSELNLGAARGDSSVDFPLYLTAVSDHEVRLSLNYDASRYDRDDIERMMGHLTALLEGMVADPQSSLDRLPMLTQEERHQLLVEWNDTAAPYPHDRCLHQLFEQQVLKTPHAIAVVHDNQQLTYQQLNDQANQLAHLLQTQGVLPDTLVAVCMNRSLDMVVALLGVLKAGGAYLALDPAYPAQRIQFTLEDADAALLITQEALLDILPQTRAHILCLDRDREAVQGSPTHNPPCAATASSLAYVLYTSGSTGRPKGVAIEHHSPVALVSWALAELSEEELSGVVFATSICFDLSVYELFVTLCGGGRVLLVHNALAIAELASEAGVSLINTVPSAMAELLRQGAVPSSVVRINLAGEPLSGSLVDALYEQTGVKKVYDLYGPSEDTTYSTCALRERGGVVSIGRPISNTRAYVLDAMGQAVPVGVAGELYLGGSGLARGYVKQAELTASKFVEDPFSSEAGARLYRTGDLVRYRRDGNLEFVGRVDHQVKVRGFRIELGEIESVLLQHRSVREAVVLAREDEPGEKRLVGYVVSEAGVSVSELREHLVSRLPVYMIPTAFVVLEALPLTPNGKVDRKALPAPEGGFAQASYVGARTPIEEGLCEIWCEVLRVREVSVDASFFELGGHSLLATQVMSRIRSTFSVELPLRALFESATIGGLAQRIEGARGSEISGAPPVVRVRRAGALPLSFSQQRLWFLDQLEPGSSVYNLPMALRLLGAVNVSALAASLGEIVRRHEALRTTFHLEAGVPRQVVEECGSALGVVDLGSLPASEREAQARRLAAEEAVRAFDLERGPLFRTSLLRLGEEEHILLVTMHHIVSDGWSIGVLRHEMETLYNAFCAGKLSPLPELPIQYADYAAWQRDWLQGEALQRQISYWKEHLAGAPSLLELPTDRPRPSVQTFRGAARRVELSAELTRNIKALSQREGSTLFMTLLAAFQTLLSRYSGQDDVVVGTPIAGRTRSEMESLIGLFLNTLALRTDLSGDPSFVELLGRVREVALGGYAHQDLPFEKLVDELQPERNMSHSPIFQVMLTLQNARRGSLNLQGLNVEGIGGSGTAAKFDMLLVAAEGRGQLGLTLEYNTDLFDGDRIERMLGHFQTLLQAIVTDPEQRLSQLPILTQAEQRQLAEFNATHRDYDLDGSIHQLIEEQALRTPDALALVFEDQQLTYSQLNARANRLAHLLRSRGVAPDTLVGLHLQRSIEMVVGILAVLKAGGAYVPFDPSYPKERLAFMLEDAGVPLLLTQRSLVTSLPSAFATSALAIEEAETRALPYSQDNPVSGVGAHHLAYMIYTSGSTGQPKGALNTHRGIRNRLLWMQEHYPLDGSDRVLQKTPFSFDVSVWEFLWPLLSGACLVVARPEGHKDPSYLVEVIQSARITTLHFVPSMLRVFVEAQGVQGCVSVRRVICSGEALAWDLTQRFFSGLSGSELHNLYGPTEAAVDVTYYACSASEAGPSIPIGRAIANTQIHLLDRFGSLVPIGVPGELYIGGVNVGRGYHNRVELSAEKFVLDPFIGDGVSRMYRTGDLCRYLWDGTLEYLGRLDHQVKIRGFRIELGEIESVLLQHASVLDAVVVVREEEPGEKRLVGYVVSEASQTPPSVSELREHLLQTLPDYMVPSAFVMLEALPLSPNGKVDRKALPAPDMARPDLSMGYTAPSTPTEEALARIWCEVLRLEQVGIHDNFFELGGDSILSIQIIARANAAGLRLTPRQVFQHQSIASLASVAGTQEVLQSEQGAVSGSVPLTPIQHWFLEQERVEAHHFNQSRLLTLRERVSVDHLKAVACALLSHHDALRLRFVRSAEGWEQSNAAEQSDEFFSVVDLSGVSAADRSAAITAVCTQLQSSLDLQEGPLLRVCYFELGAEEPARLFLMIHHLGVDGVSWRVLLEDLATGMEQLRSGEAISLPAKTTSFQQWAQRLQGYANSSSALSELDYWQSVSKSGVRALPVDFATGTNTVASERVVRVSLDTEETRALLSEVPAVYHTQINDVLLTALARSVGSWTGDRRVLVDLEGHGREALFEELDVSRTLGWFTSLYPVLLELAPSSDWGESLKGVKESLRGVPNRGLGYGVLRYLSADAWMGESLSQGVGAQISFNYHGQVEAASGGSGLLGAARESAGPVHSLRASRTHVLDVIGQVTGERLQMAFFYSEALYARSTVEGLAQSYLQSLRALIAHCQSPDAGGYTPSDFPEATVSQKSLDRLLAGIRKK